MQKKTVIILIAMILVSALLGTSVLTRGHFWGDDFAAYIMQAKSILAGNMDEFVETNAFTVIQSSHEKGHQMGPAAYPWGFPLLLTPAYLMFGLHPLGLKLPVVFTYLCFLVVFFLWTSRRFSPTESLLAVSLFAFNPGLVLFLDEIVSDIPFLFVSTLAILLADMYVHENEPTRKTRLGILTGVVFFLAFFVRTQGLILLGSFLLFQGIRFLGNPKERLQLVKDSLLTVLSFGVLWGLSSLIFPGGQSSYLSLYEDFSLALVKSNFISYSNLFGEFFEPLPGGTILLLIFTLLFFVGLITRFKEDLFLFLYALLYLLVIWTWPEWQGYRFIFPVLPLYIFFSFWGIKTLSGRLKEDKKTLGQKISYGFLALVGIGFLYFSGINAYGNLQAGREINGPFDPFSRDTFDFIAAETPTDSIIVFFKPRAMRLFTERDTLALTECERMPEGDYLALSKKVGENLQIPPERIDECKLSLENVFENRRFVVYRILK